MTNCGRLNIIPNKIPTGFYRNQQIDSKLYGNAKNQSHHHKRKAMGWREASAVRSTSCSSRYLGAIPCTHIKTTHNSSSRGIQHSLLISEGRRHTHGTRTYMHTWCTDTHAHMADIHTHMAHRHMHTWHSHTCTNGKQTHMQAKHPYIKLIF